MFCSGVSSRASEPVTQAVMMGKGWRGAVVVVVSHSLLEKGLRTPRAWWRGWVLKEEAAAGGGGGTGRCGVLCPGSFLERGAESVA